MSTAAAAAASIYACMHVEESVGGGNEGVRVRVCIDDRATESFLASATFQFFLHLLLPETSWLSHAQ